MVAAKDYYKVLQVDPSAELEIVEAAYRRLALKYHPDVNSSPDAGRRMQDINEAYDVLSNPAKRAQFDLTRSDELAPQKNWYRGADSTAAGANRAYQTRQQADEFRSAEQDERRRKQAEAARKRRAEKRAESERYAQEERRRSEQAEADEYRRRAEAMAEMARQAKQRQSTPSQNGLKTDSTPLTATGISTSEKRFFSWITHRQKFEDALFDIFTSEKRFFSWIVLGFSLIVVLLAFISESMPKNSSVDQPTLSIGGNVSPTYENITTASPGIALSATGETKLGEVVFDTDRDGDWEIFVVTEDATRETQLTYNSADDRFPDWSPDGRKIVFASDRNADFGQFDLFIMNQDGTEQTQLTFDMMASEPSWSPDGRQIAFVSEQDGSQAIYVIEVNGAGQSRLTDLQYNNFTPSWSPDGSSIVFTSDRNGWDIYMMRNDGSLQTRLTTSPATDWAPEWAPNGQQIVFVSSRDDNPEIYVMDTEGSNQQRLTFNSDNDTVPDWSPDGMQVVFAYGTSRHLDIYIMGVDGSHRRAITNNPTNDSFPSWRP